MIPAYLYPATIALCLVAVVAAYFFNNPMKHGRWFMVRRFINWFPLGMTYAFLCMGRYNLIVAKSALGTLMSNRIWDYFWRGHVDLCAVVPGQRAAH